MKSKDFLRSKGILSNDSHHFIIDFHDGREINLAELLEEYAQQSQPSGMRWVRASENPDPGKSKWYIVKTDTHAGRCYCGDKYAMSRYCIENKISMDDLFYLDESSPAGAAEGASDVWVRQNARGVCLRLRQREMRV